MIRLSNWYSIAVFLVAGMATVTFAFASVNLFTAAMASVSFIGEYKWEAIRHGALWQVLELLVSGSIALGGWLIFKICEHILVERYLAWSKVPRTERRARRQKKDA